VEEREVVLVVLRPADQDAAVHVLVDVAAEWAKLAVVLVPPAGG
jgi:hypothetical protein